MEFGLEFGGQSRRRGLSPILERIIFKKVEMVEVQERRKEREEEEEDIKEVDQEIPIKEKNYKLRKMVFVNEKAYEKFRNDIIKDRKLILNRVFNAKNELKYRPRILDIIETMNWGLLTRDYNHLD
ncbi:hypothetical protein Syun_027633 [Stephania yunnanensis]|uniref:Uncharacterized protein n=1 Tax=Stephania yunnanensis TaxID=152371 RepID=A0AAP0EJA1_9MAGN